MTKNLKLTATNLPRRMADLTHSNQFLKIFSFLSLILLILSLFAVLTLANRAPRIIAFDLSAQQLESTKLPAVKKMIENAIREYIRHRYEWTNNDVETKLREAQNFISPKNHQAYLKATKKVAEFSLAQKAMQMAYPRSIDIDLKTSVAHVTGDRVTSIMGVRAAGALNLELHFASGPHAPTNPWGVYITKEVEIL